MVHLKSKPAYKVMLNISHFTQYIILSLGEKAFSCRYKNGLLKRKAFENFFSFILFHRFQIRLLHIKHLYKVGDGYLLG